MGVGGTGVGVLPGVGVAVGTGVGVLPGVGVADALVVGVGTGVPPVSAQLVPAGSITVRKALVALAPVAPLVDWKAVVVTGKSPE